MQKLLEQMERAGYHTGWGFPLEGNADWGELKAYAIEADRAMKLLMERAQS